MSRIFINFEFKDGPWGGANQFLKGLRSYLVESGTLAKNWRESSAVLINSHHKLLSSAITQLFFPKYLVLRMDGPVSVVRESNKAIDLLISSFATEVADKVIYQTEWSRAKNFEIAANLIQVPYDVIQNAADSKIFYPKEKNFECGNMRKISILISSWSSNIRKGFDYYDYLDSSLDFDKYSVTFIGNSPRVFKHIVNLPPIPSDELANELRKSDIYLTASIDDPCSNSLIEATQCGLVTVCKDSGGHPEITEYPSLLFSTQSELLDRIESAAKIVLAGDTARSGRDEKCAFSEYVTAIGNSRSTRAKPLLHRFRSLVVFAYAYAVFLVSKIGPSA